MSALKVAKDLALEAGKEFATPFALAEWVATINPALGAQALEACLDAKEFVGTNIIVKTVGEILVGRLIAANEGELLLHPCAWAADTGRWAQCLTEGSLSEVEPYADPVRVSRGAIVVWTHWGHEVPREVR